MLISATVAKGHILKFHVPYLEWFKKMGWETWVAAGNDSGSANMEIPHCDHYVEIPFSRNPFSLDNIEAYKKIKHLIDSEEFDLIHSHTPIAGVLTRLAARNRDREKARSVYTAHGFHFYKGAPLKNWILWYPIEKIMASYTDLLFTINQEDYDRADRKFACRVAYVPGVGFNGDKIAEEVDKSAIRKRIGVPEDAYVIVNVGDLAPGKNQGVLIEALSLFGGDVHLVICGEGPERQNLEALSKAASVSDRVHLLGFREDIGAMLSISDLFCFPSQREGLPVSVLEAMAAGLPVVASDIRGIVPDLIEDGENGIVLEEGAPEEIGSAVNRIREDQEYRDMLTREARKRVSRFELSNVLVEMNEQYRLIGLETFL